MAFMFEKPIVYQKAISYADCICGITEKFPRGYGFLADQLNRASVSIAANIAEGNGRFTIPAAGQNRAGEFGAVEQESTQVWD